MSPPSDSLRAVLDTVFAAPDYRWVERPESWATLRRWLRMLQQWLLELHDTHPAAFRGLVLGLLLLVMATFAHAAWVFLRTLRAAHATPDPGPSSTAVRRDRAWFHHQADRLAAESRYAEAMQYDFLALVLALDALARVRFHPAKTPGEYVREARLDPEPLERLKELVRALYGFVFARRPCGPTEYAAWRRMAAPERYASGA
jgi:hypothetical protein